MLYRLDFWPGKTFVATTDSLGLTADDAAAMRERRLPADRARLISMVARSAMDKLEAVEPYGYC